MAQYEILDFLRENPNKKFTNKEISRALGVRTLTMPLLRLKKSKMIKSETVKKEGTIYKHLVFWYSNRRKLHKK